MFTLLTTFILSAWGTGGCVSSTPVSPCAPTFPSAPAAVSTLEIECAENAVVRLEGQVMPGHGTLRRFVSPPLPKGVRHTYKITVDGVLREVPFYPGNPVQVRRATPITGVDEKWAHSPAPSSTAITNEGPVDDSAKCWITFVGADGKRAKEEWEPLKLDYKAHLYDRDHWSLVTGGFPKDTVVSVQNADGVELHRQVDYQPGDMKAVAGKLRKPVESYDATKTPDLRKELVLPLPLIVVVIGVAVLIFRKRDE